MNLELYDPAETDPEAYQAALIKCGGPAFPVTDMSKTQCAGISIRDWFAGQALAGMIAHKDSGNWHSRDMAKDCYGYADAMIAARKESK